MRRIILTIALMLLARAASASITFHSAVTASSVAADHLDVVLTGSDVSAGDVCLAQISVAASPNIDVTPDGWILIREVTNGVLVIR